MVQTSVGDGLLEAQKQSLLNSSLWSRSREAGSPGAFPHFLSVSSIPLLFFSSLVARKKTLVKARTRVQRLSMTFVACLLGADAEVKASLMHPPVSLLSCFLRSRIDADPLNPFQKRHLYRLDRVVFSWKFYVFDIREIPSVAPCPSFKGQHCPVRRA